MKPNMRFLQAGQLRRAFSLVELLVVIGIVALLAGLLLPAFNKARQTARDNTVANNFRQLSSAELMYANDNDGRFASIWNVDHVVWQAKLVPYLYPSLDATNASAGLITTQSRSVFNVPERVNKNAASIAVNWSISDPRWDYRRLLIPNPANTILLAEMVERNSDTLVPAELGGGKGSPATPGFRRANNTRAYVLFCDGHVEAVNENSLSFFGKTPENNLWRWW